MYLYIRDNLYVFHLRNKKELYRATWVKRRSSKGKRHHQKKTDSILRKGISHTHFIELFVPN